MLRHTLPGSKKIRNRWCSSCHVKVWVAVLLSVNAEDIKSLGQKEVTESAKWQSSGLHLRSIRFWTILTSQGQRSRVKLIAGQSLDRLPGYKVLRLRASFRSCDQRVQEWQHLKQLTNILQTFQTNFVEELDTFSSPSAQDSPLLSHDFLHLFHLHYSKVRLQPHFLKCFLPTLN
jgi:hypothetical protein